MAKRNNKAFEETKFVEVKIDSPDEHEFMFFHSPKKDFLYVVIIEDTAYGKSTLENFKEAFKKSINVSEKEFDRIYRMNPKSEIILFGNDFTIDRYKDDEETN